MLTTSSVAAEFNDDYLRKLKSLEYRSSQDAYSVSGQQAHMSSSNGKVDFSESLTLAVSREVVHLVTLQSLVSLILEADEVISELDELEDTEAYYHGVGELFALKIAYLSVSKAHAQFSTLVSRNLSRRPEEFEAIRFAARDVFKEHTNSDFLSFDSRLGAYRQMITSNSNAWNVMQSPTFKGF